MLKAKRGDMYTAKWNEGDLTIAEKVQETSLGIGTQQCARVTTVIN